MRTLNEAEILCIKRLKAKGVSLYDIAERLSLTIEEVMYVLQNKIK